MMRSSLRDIATAEIYIGAINQKAQSEAKASAELWKYADPQAPLHSDDKVIQKYFTWEEKINRLDGTMLFVPESDTETVYNNGIVTERISTKESPQAVIFSFGTVGMDIKGLTIEFGISYPLTFKVETDTSIEEYENTSGSFVTEDVFSNISYIKIIPGMMSCGQTRFRIEKILFGIGITLAGQKKIISLDIKEKVHPISLDLPTIDLSFTVDNLDRYFNANADSSMINFLEKGQPVKVYFRQTLADGSTEMVVGANAMLDSWVDKTSQAEFTATDRLWQMDGLYEDGIYRKEGVPAYDLLLDVFAKAGLSTGDYFVDPYLKNVILHNPLPKDTYANCILLIANACRCIMRQDREMKLIIKASFIPELNVTAGEGTVFSQTERLLEQAGVTEYFDWQQSYNRLDGKMFWVPEGEEVKYAGYVSKEISDGQGCFRENPYVTVTAEAAFNFYQLTLNFGEVHPEKACIHCCRNGMETETFEVDIFGKLLIVNHSFTEVDEVKIEFIKAAPFNRVSVQHISIAEMTDFVVGRDDMLSEPTTERQDRVKDIIAIRTVYTRPEAASSLFSDQITVSAEKAAFKLEFNEASIPVSIVTTIPVDDGGMEEVEVDYGAEIQQYSNWYCRICFKNPPEKPVRVQLEVMGYTYKVTNPQYIHQVNTTGTTPSALSNPLVDTEELAASYAAWCAEYYAARAEYTIPKYMGDPVLEANDLAYYEDENNKKQLIRVHTIQLKFDGSYNDSSCAGRSL